MSRKGYKMQITIIGHNINIVGLEDFDYTKGNDSFIYEINDLIFEGHDSGNVTINDVSYEWEIIQNIDYDEYKNICFENKKMAEFLIKLGLTSEEITSVVINGDIQNTNFLINKIKISDLNLKFQDSIIQNYFKQISKEDYQLCIDSFFEKVVSSLKKNGIEKTSICYDLDITILQQIKL